MLGYSIVKTTQICSTQVQKETAEKQAAFWKKECIRWREKYEMGCDACQYKQIADILHAKEEAQV